MRIRPLCRAPPRLVKPGARGAALSPAKRAYSTQTTPTGAVPTARHSRNDRPFRMAVIGSGPAGFYTAYRVMSKLQGAKVDMYEALPVPFGLVRFGVAPDHPEVKNCQEKFEEVASSPDFTFIGNMSVGSPSGHPDGGSIPLPLLLPNYDAVVFAYGAAQDRTLGVPGESLQGVYSAREFVGWYNGLPEHAGLAPDLTAGEEAVIIGQGNVALDVARMLLESVDALRKTDIAEHALETLSRSRVKRVHVVGRRGPMQAAFTIKEARELMKLHDVGFQSIERSLIPADTKKLPRAPKRLMDLLLKGSSSPATTPKSWSLDFCLSPAEFRSRTDDSTRIGSVKFNRTTLSDPFDLNARVQQLSSDLPVELPASLAFRSIGYRSVPLWGFSDLAVDFDERRGVLPNEGGRVARASSSSDAAAAPGRFPGLYCSGWVKRGPTGVIASTMEDAFATADAVLQDWQTGADFLPFQGGDSTPRPGWDAVSREASATGARVVSWDDWHKIDQAERERGKLKGKEREKLPTISGMLSVLS